MFSLIKYSIRKIFFISFILSLFFSFVISQIELLDYIERKGSNLLSVFATSMFGYLPEIFILTLPVSSLRFFRERKQMINQLETFGFSKGKLIAYYFIPSVFVFSFLNFFCLGTLSTYMKLRLKLLKGDQKKEIVIVEDDQIIFARRKEEKDGERKFEISKLSLKGRILDKREESGDVKIGKDTLYELTVKGRMEKPMENPVKYILFTILVSNSFLLSMILGLSYINFVIVLVITLGSLSICAFVFGAL